MDLQRVQRRFERDAQTMHDRLHKQDEMVMEISLRVGKSQTSPSISPFGATDSPLIRRSTSDIPKIPLPSSCSSSAPQTPLLSMRRVMSLQQPLPVHQLP